MLGTEQLLAVCLEDDRIKGRESVDSAKRSPLSNSPHSCRMQHVLRPVSGPRTPEMAPRPSRHEGSPRGQQRAHRAWSGLCQDPHLAQDLRLMAC